MFYKRGEIKLSEKSQEIYDKLIEHDSDLYMIKNEFDFSFIYNEIKQFYCLNNGRNSIDGVLALKGIFVQKYCGLRDRQLERKGKYDLEIKYFLDIEVDEEAFDFTTIWKFKKMLGEEKVEAIFNHILEQIKSKGIIKSFRRQAIDTIPILAAASLPSIICLIYQSIKGVCNSVTNEILEKIFAETELTKEKLEHYSKPRPLFRTEDSEKLKTFQKAVKRGFQILDIVHSNQLTSEEISLLEEILQDNVRQKKDDEHQRKFTEHTKKSLVDKDATLGHKTKKDVIYGYKAGVSVTPEGIITAYEITPMSHRDDEHLIPLLEMQEKNGTKCEEADADSAFGFIQNYVDAKAKNIILHAPVRNFDPEKLSAYDFNYDKEKHELTCINNVTVKGRNSGALTFEFPIRKCRKDCPMKDNCPLSPSKVTTLNKNYKVAREAMARQREDREIDKQNREKGIKNFKRLVVENVFAFLEKLGIKVTPAYSLKMTKVHVGLVVTLSNMLKTVRKLKKKKKEEKLRMQAQKISSLEKSVRKVSVNFLAYTV